MSGGQFYPDWVIKKNLTSFWDECNVVLHELIKEGKPINSAAIQARLCQKEKALGVDRIIKKDGDSDNKVNLAIEKCDTPKNFIWFLSKTLWFEERLF